MTAAEGDLHVTRKKKPPHVAAYFGIYVFSQEAVRLSGKHFTETSFDLHAGAKVFCYLMRNRCRCFFVTAAGSTLLHAQHGGFGD